LQRNNNQRFAFQGGSLSELRIDRQVRDDAHRQPDGFALFTHTEPNNTTAPAAAVSPSPKPAPKQSSGLADLTKRLEHCIGLQAMAISLSEAERRAPLAPPGVELLALLRETIKHQRSIALDFRTLQVEVQSLRNERDNLAVALLHMETLSLTDELTGLPNRRAFIQRLEQELSRSQRSGQPVAMVLLDIDNFKGVNDGYGHYVGDMILRCYAESMVRELRQHDLLARYGGEEFVLLLPETSLDDARNALVKLSDRIRREPLDAGGTCIDLPSFSAGIAGLRPGESAKALINRADQSLYRAKRLGRNRIETDEVTDTAQRR
jgi:diguanylate cyclase (GGDEF)-like protein